MLLVEQRGFGKGCVLACSSGEQCVFSSRAPGSPVAVCPSPPCCPPAVLGSLCRKQGAGRRDGVPLPEKGGGHLSQVMGADLCTPGAPTDRFCSPFTGTEEMQTPPCLRPPAPGDLEGPPPHFCPQEQDWERPSTQREAFGMDLIPDGRGWAPRCSELLLGDSPACVCLGVQIQLMDTPACYSCR